MSIVNEFNLYNRLRDSLIENFNTKVRSDTLSNADISSTDRELRYIRRCMLKIMRENLDIKLKATVWRFVNGYYIKWSYDNV